jgi:hypothetical protein
MEVELRLDEQAGGGGELPMEDVAELRSKHERRRRIWGKEERTVGVGFGGDEEMRRRSGGFHSLSGILLSLSSSRESKEGKRS